MRIHLIADLHAEFTAGKLKLPNVECDLHLVCGDGAAPLTHALPIIADAFKGSTAIKAYIPGNHDFYHTSEHPHSFMQDELARGREMGRRLGVTVLSNDVLILGDTRVLGTTLWTDFRAGDPSMSRKMKMSQSQKGWYGDERRDGGGGRDYHEDFRQIRFGGFGTKNRFTPSQWLVLHEESMAFLRSELEIDHIGETVVASHMAPSTQSLMPGSHMHDWLYATTDCDDLFQSVDLWAHGHIHQSRDYEVDGCRVVCNPRGYPNKGGGFENASWDPAMVIEVERRYAPSFERT